MSKSILILTPDPETASFDGRWREVLDAYLDALKDADLAISHQPWSEPVTKAYDLILPLMAWGYHSLPQKFGQALDGLMSAHMRNPAAVLHWNMDKRYLRDLADEGIRIIPTIFTESVTENDIKRAKIDFGTEALVIKPVVSAGAKNTVVHADFEVPEAGPKGAAMIQPFMPTIQTEGEWSLIYLGGKLSHAVLKTPKSGDFRSQPDYDAHLRVLTPPEGALDLAEAVIDVVGRDQLLYARVDMVRAVSNGDDFCLMEVELIEPDLYLAFAEGSAHRFKHALLHSLH